MPARPPPERVRAAVRELLLACEGFGQLDAPTRRDLARGLVTICATAQTLGEEGAAAQRQLAQAQSAGSEFSGVSALRVADTTKQILNAVSFPRFVTELINGVFKAIVDTNQQQLGSYVELIRNVASSVDGFADANVGVGGARGWLAERFPESFEISGASDDDTPPADAEEARERAAEAAANTRLRLRPAASMPSPAALRLVLGLPEGEATGGGDPESLVPLARMAMARNRQQMLSTMVMLGLQRIVIDSGRLHASMRFHIDTRSAANDDRGSQFDARHSSTLQGSVGFGPWGASAAMTNTIGYVSTQKTQTTEEMNTDLNLDSSVELVFKTDYLPLERLAGGPQLERIKVNTLNPEAELKADREARSERDKSRREAETKRGDSLSKDWSKPPTDGPKAPEVPKPEERAKPKPEAKPPIELKPGAGAAPAAGAAPGANSAAPTPGSSRAAAPGAALALAEPERKPDVVFVPTPPEVVDTLLQLAAPRPGERLVDLGCGDGRILVEAAARHGCHAQGYDIDPRRVAQAQARIAKAGVGALARVEQRDLFTVDLADADIVTLYLLPQLNARLLPQLQRLRPGARVVSHDFAIEGLVPRRVVQDHLPSLGLTKTCFLYTAPLTPANGPRLREWRESAEAIG
jgi:precorrin-6B methylase 2